jgi:hypothetical protein
MHAEPHPIKEIIRAHIFWPYNIVCQCIAYPTTVVCTVTGHLGTSPQHLQNHTSISPPDWRRTKYPKFPVDLGCCGQCAPYEKPTQSGIQPWLIMDRVLSGWFNLAKLKLITCVVWCSRHIVYSTSKYIVEYRNQRITGLLLSTIITRILLWLLITRLSWRLPSSLHGGAWIPVALCARRRLPPEF